MNGLFKGATISFWPLIEALIISASLVQYSCTEHHLCEAYSVQIIDIKYWLEFIDSLALFHFLKLPKTLNNEYVKFVLIISIHRLNS